MQERLRSATESRPGDSGIIGNPQESASESTVALGVRKTTKSIRSQIRECRRCVRELYSLGLEVLAILGLAAVFWWHFHDDFHSIQHVVPETREVKK